MNVVLFVLIVGAAASAGVVMGALFAVNARRDLEVENASLRERLFGKPNEEHA